jgi:hypothetical protein
MFSSTLLSTLNDLLNSNRNSYYVISSTICALIILIIATVAENPISKRALEILMLLLVFVLLLSIIDKKWNESSESFSNNLGFGLPIICYTLSFIIFAKNDTINKLNQGDSYFLFLNLPIIIQLSLTILNSFVSVRYTSIKKFDNQEAGKYGFLYFKFRFTSSIVISTCFFIFALVEHLNLKGKNLEAISANVNFCQFSLYSIWLVIIVSWLYKILLILKKDG